MLNNAKCTGFIPCKDLENTRRFYEDVLGFSVIKETPGGISYRSGDTEFALYPSSYGGTGQHTLVGFEVDDVEAEVEELGGKGIKFEQYDFPELKTNDKGIAEIEGEKGAWFKDPEGNILAIFHEGAFG